MTHEHVIRVYYEDTDLAGIVYYANYLRFIERARTEMLRGHGIDQGRLRSERGLVFAVRRIEADFMKPARFDDMLRVATGDFRLSGARLTLRQTVLRGSETLFCAEVTLACVHHSGRPVRIPAELRLAIEQSSEKH